MSPRLTDSVPPPAGSRNPCAQPFTGAASGVSGWPFKVADQPAAGAASISVPPAAGAFAPATLTGPDGTATTVPPGPVSVAGAKAPAAGGAPVDGGRQQHVPDPEAGQHACLVLGSAAGGGGQGRHTQVQRPLSRGGQRDFLGAD